MSNKGYYYARIRSLEQEIASCNGKISKINQQVEELAVLKNRISLYEESFVQTQSARQNRLSVAVGTLFSGKRYSHKIIQSYEQGMGELLSGSEQQNTVNGMGMAYEKVNEKIRALYAQLEECKQRIISCNAKIAECRREIQRIEERERACGGYSY